MGTMSTCLSIMETTELGECEVIIERDLRTFVEVGNALLHIRDGRLYRAQHASFEAYCRERWGMARNYANKVIRAAETVSQLGTTVPILPTTERQARPLTRLAPEQQAPAWQRAVETAADGRVTAAHIQRIVEEEFFSRSKEQAAQAMAVTVFSHGSIEYYTPSVYVDAARCVMGGIDLDPASCDAAQEIVQAGRYYTEESDGLRQSWHGRVWLNPPYSKTGGESNQSIWSQRLIQEYRRRNVTEAILLVRAALGYKWFEDIWCDWPICFARERLSFIKSDGSSDGQSKQATAFFYLGPNVARFAAVFRKFGRIIPPEEQLA